jgi:DeoR family transcriptional regulator, suf operon transcriptional repressor
MRGEILVALCSRRLTAVELATRFDVTSNAIRTHLAALRAADLVRYTTEVRGVGKPTHVYELTAAGQDLLSTAYAPALGTLLRAIRLTVGSRVDAILHEAGRQLANGQAKRDRATSVDARVRECVELLQSLGGDAEVRRDAQRYVIRSSCCPLASVVKTAPDACKLFEGMARAIIDREVVERCDRAGRPQCLFVVSGD